MSSAPGHWAITRAAVAALLAEAPGDPARRALARARLPLHATLRDARDLLNGGHWAAAGQARHFLRPARGASPAAAHAAAVAWIRARAERGAAGLAAWLGRGPAAPRGNFAVALGDACHALQDSFAPGHAVRRAASGEEPGPVSDVLVYRLAPAALARHHALDEAWRELGAPQGLSPAGRRAVAATRALLACVAAAAAGAGAAAPLPGWDAFRARWLAAAPELDAAGAPHQATGSVGR